MITETGIAGTVKEKCHQCEAKESLNEPEAYRLHYGKMPLLKVLHVIASNPGIIKKDVGSALGLTRTGGLWHISKLVRQGAVEEVRIHGHCALRVLEPKYAMLRQILADQAATPRSDTPVDAPALLQAARESPNGS